MFTRSVRTEFAIGRVVDAVRGGGDVGERPVERAAGEVERCSSEARLELERQRAHRAAARTDAREARAEVLQVVERALAHAQAAVQVHLFTDTHCTVYMYICVYL